MLVSIREQCTLDTPHPARKRSSTYGLHPPAVMAQRFARYPEAVANTPRLAERCRVSLDFRAVRFPPLPHLVPPGETADETLRRLAYEGAWRRYGELSARVVRQLEHELGGDWPAGGGPLLPDLRGSRHSLPGGGDAARRLIPWSPITWGSARSTRCATGCSSSVSSTRSAPRCRTSTLTSGSTTASGPSPTSTRPTASSTRLWSATT